MMVEIKDIRRHALNVNHVLLGAISSNFRMVSVSLNGQKVKIEIVLQSHSDEDLEEIERFLKR